MLTYLLDQIAPVKDIIEASGKFGPDQQHQVIAIYEVLNVFGGTEWALFMDSTPTQTEADMQSNPFFAEYDLIWVLGDTRPVVEIGSVARIAISRKVAHAILKAKFGANEHVQNYIDESEHQDGFGYWNDHFADDAGFDRLALIDDFEAWTSALEVSPSS